jgi:hypothetical protein
VGGMIVDAIFSSKLGEDDSLDEYSLARLEQVPVAQELEV